MEESKKKYVAPKAEKLEFDYTDIVCASTDYGDDPNGQYYKCTGSSYWEG